jgi:hypothetical protein
MPANDEPIQTAMIAPTRYWPWPPMLNIPQRNANATASPVRIERRRLLEQQRLLEVVPRGVCVAVNGTPVTHLEEPVQAGAVEDRLVGRRAGCGPSPATTRPPIEEREDRRQQRRRSSRRPLCSATSARERLVARLVDARAVSVVGRPLRLAHAASEPAAAESSRGRAPPRRRRRELADDLALVDDEDPVGEREDLLELERDEQDRAALVALLDEAAVDELDRADVEAARRLRGDQHLRVAAISRASTTFCWLPPESAPARVRAAAAHVELAQQPARALDQRFGNSQPKRESGGSA